MTDKWQVTGSSLCVSHQSTNILLFMRIQAPGRRDPSLCYSIHHPLWHTWLNTASLNRLQFSCTIWGCSCHSPWTTPSLDGMSTSQFRWPGTQISRMELKFTSAHKRRRSASYFYCLLDKKMSVQSTTVSWSYIADAPTPAKRGGLLANWSV